MLLTKSMTTRSFVNSLHSSPKILFNTELSLFGDKLLPLVATKYDNIIDSRFLDFGFHFKCFMSADPITNKLLQPTELMTSGRYLPELTRLVLCDLIASNNIFSQVQDLSTIRDHPFDGFNGEIMCFVNESVIWMPSRRKYVPNITGINQ